MTTVHDLLNAAVAHHTAGRLPDAEQGYRRVLEADPQNADAFHLLGLIASAVGKPQHANGLIRWSLALNPALGDAWFNLGNLERRRGRATEAFAALRCAAALAPTPRNRNAAGLALAETLATAAGGLPALNAAFNAVHMRNRAAPDWRGDALLERLGPEGRRRVLHDAGTALELAPREPTVAYLVAMLRVAGGDLEGGLDALARPTDGDTADLSRLAAEVAWHLRRPDAARAHYEAFIRRKCEGEAPLRPLLPKVAEAEAFRRRPRPPAGRPVLIYTHYGNPDYLHYSIGQNLVANPSARIVLIGDRENRIEGIDHRLIQDYAGLSREVVGLYRHDSNNAYCYELFCIARWFVFLDLCRREGFEEMFFLDSDYMLFTDLNAEVGRLRETGVAFSLNSAHFSYFTIDRLTEFCEHIRAFFHGDEDTGSFHRRNNSDLFSDMAFIFDYQRGHPWRNLCRVEDGRFFDYSITSPDGFRCTGGIKDIWFEDGAPWGFHEESGRPVRLSGLHFQGNSKPLMEEAFFRRGWGRAGRGGAAS